MPDSTPDWKLKAFSWLSLDKWTSDRLFNMTAVDGKHYCKICDEYIPVAQMEKHIKFHIKEEQARVARVRAEEAARREAEREWIRQENAFLKPSKPTSEGGNMAEKTYAPRQASVEAVNKIESALRGSGGLTLASLAEATGLKLSTVKSQIKNVNGVEVIGQHKAGGRGRPADVYGVS